ncbi:hypothetical protein CONPUDRAFT_21544, partial [Coniophora puteana RWD-64-598 SS2]
SRHGDWYAEMLPGMVPVALLGSAVYLVSLSILLFLPDLAHERYLDEANARVRELEQQVDVLLAERVNGHSSSN